jgi:hypothetical protein
MQRYPNFITKKVFVDQTFRRRPRKVFEHFGGRMSKGTHLMTNRAPAKYSGQSLNDVLSVPRKPLVMTATLKRRALKKTLGKSGKKAEQKNRDGGAIPAILSCAARPE